MALVQLDSRLDIFEPGHTDFMKLCVEILNFLEKELELKGFSCVFRTSKLAPCTREAEMAWSGERFVRLIHDRDKSWFNSYKANESSHHDSTCYFRDGLSGICDNVISYLLSGILIRHKSLNEKIFARINAINEGIAK